MPVVPTGLPIVARPSLVARVAAARVALLRAPAGYGASTLLAEVVAAADVPALRATLPPGTAGGADVVAVLRRAAVRAGHADLAAALAAPVGTPGLDPDAALDNLLVALGALPARLVAIDDVHHAGPAAAAWLAALATDLPTPARLVLAGRSLAAALPPGTVVLTERDLAFGVAEVENLLRLVVPRGTAADEAATILRATDGWPAAVAVAVGASALLGGERWRTGGGDGRAVAGAGAHRPSAATGRPRQGPSRGGGPALAALVDDLLAAAPPEVANLARAVGALPMVSPALVDDAAGPGAFAALVAAGLPLRQRPDGWYEVAGPVRSALGAGVPPPALARLAAAHYARGDEVAEAVGLLHRTGDDAGLLDLLADLAWTAVEDLGSSLVLAVVEGMADEVLGAHADGLAAAAGALARTDVARWGPVLDRALGSVPPSTPAGRSLAVERAWVLARSDPGAALVVLDEALDALRGGGPGAEGLTRLRALLTRGVLRLWVGTEVWRAGATADLEAAAGLARLLGEPRLEARAHVALGLGVHEHTGDLERALHHHGLAVAVLGGADAARADALTYLGAVLVQAGREDEAERALDEALGIGRRLHLDQATAYAAWARAALAAARGDAAGVAAWLAEAERHPGPWSTGPAGVELLADGARLLAQAGDLDGAARMLARAEVAAGPETEHLLLPSRARLAAEAAALAEAAAALAAWAGHPDAAPAEAWRRHLLAAVVAARAGDVEAARAAWTSAEADVVAAGDPGRLARREPRLVALLAGSGSAVVGAAGRASPARPGPGGPDGHGGAISSTGWRLRLLGGFSVLHDGADRTPPPGHAATLVKLLAVEGPLTTEQATDRLWPDADPATGRSRLRNLLNRLRAASGPLVERREDALVLAAGTWVDAVAFEQEALAALGAPPQERAGRCRLVLAAHPAELLPADRYADWATVPRERLRRRHLALLDVVADAALAHDDADEAVALLESALALEPLDEERYVRAAEALARQGRATSARATAARGLAVLAELGVRPSARLAALAGDADG